MNEISYECMWAIQEFMYGVGLATESDYVRVDRQIRSEDRGLYSFVETPSKLYKVYYSKNLYRDKINHIMTVVYKIEKAVEITDLSVIKKYLERKGIQ